MSSTYIVYNIVPIGFLILLIYIFIDILLDWFREPKRDILNRVILYSFLFYVLCLIQITFGGFIFSPRNPSDEMSSYVSSGDWFGIFDTMYFKIYVWSVSVLFYNVLLLIPFGIYLKILFHIKSYNQAVSIVVLCCGGIGIVHILFSKLELVIGSTNIFILISLITSIIGGIIGLIISMNTGKVFNLNRKELKKI